jgi:hypothetical protein
MRRGVIGLRARRRALLADRAVEIAAARASPELSVDGS